MPEENWPKFAQFSSEEFTELFQSSYEKIKILRNRQYDQQNLDQFGNKIISRINLKVWLLTQHVSLRCDSFRYQLISQKTDLYRPRNLRCKDKPRVSLANYSSVQKDHRSNKQKKFNRK